MDFSSFGGSLASYTPVVTSAINIRRQHVKQPDSHLCQAVPPCAPRNTSHIFRRGKCLDNLKQDSKFLAGAGEVNTDASDRAIKPPSLAMSDAELRQLKERERMVLHEYAPDGLGTTPPGCFDRTKDKLSNSPINQNMFEEQELCNPKAMSFEVEDNKGRQIKAISFEMEDVVSFILNLLRPRLS